MVCILTPFIQEYRIPYYIPEHTQAGFYEQFPNPYWGVLSFWKAYHLALMSFSYNLCSFALKGYEYMKRHVARAILKYDKNYEYNHRDLIQYFNSVLMLTFPCKSELSINWLYNKDGKK